MITSRFSAKGLDQKYEDRAAELNHEAHEQVAREAEEAGDGYYHPEWHRFNPEGDARDEIYRELYGAGYVRLGTGKWSGDKFMDCQGHEEFIERHGWLIKEIFVLLGLDKVTATTTTINGRNLKNRTIHSKR